MFLYLQLISGLPGVLPDWMHICYLSIVSDICVSIFMDLTDDAFVFSGETRDARLFQLWTCYRDWCESTSAWSI